MASSIRELFLKNSAFWLRLRDFAALFATLVALTEPIFLSASRTNWIRKAIAAIGAGDEKGEPEFGASRERNVLPRYQTGWAADSA
jgi:hypothetical protein